MCVVCVIEQLYDSVVTPRPLTGPAQTPLPQHVEQNRVSWNGRLRGSRYSVQLHSHWNQPQHDPDTHGQCTSVYLDNYIHRSYNTTLTKWQSKQLEQL